MRSPAVALAWEFRRRHRWGLLAVAGYVLALAAARLLIFRPGAVVPLDSERFAFTVIVPLTSAFFYLLAVFTFGLTGDVGARESPYPVRMFTLPVRTGPLAGWPMLYGTVTAACLWLATAGFVLRPSGIELPLLWPALFAAAFLAWTQALTWMPYGLPGLRVAVSLLLLVTADAVVVLAIYAKVPESLMTAVMAPQVPLAYLVARAAVARARRGDVPDWRERFSRVGRLAGALPGRRDPFASPAHAQRWLEWRRHGRALPVLVGILLPFELGLLFLPGSDTPALFFEILFVVLLTPPVMATVAAAAINKPDAGEGGDRGLTPFLATRPLTGGELVAAKLRMAMGSTLAAWLLVLATVPVAVAWSGTGPVLMDGMRRAADAVGAPRTVVVVLLALGALGAATWSQLVQSLYIGLSGREWLAKASTFLTLALLVAVLPVLQWIGASPRVQAALWDAVPWIPAVLVLAKMSAAAWVAARLVHGRLLSDRALVGGAAAWALVVLGLYGLLVWLFDTPHVPRYFLALVAILAVPLARLSAAPLALAWNRHR
ncbi:MAG: hypothetical protein Q8N53_04690 [Longimicrobiales bacterium]|nr:hypothetical protein [Longimicrobiales bacterium]